jgi:hypothetical protein
VTLLLLLSLLSPASADTLTCEATTGPKLVYAYWGKSGGNVGQGVPVFTQTWSLNGETLHTITETYGEEQVVRGDLDWLWDLSSRVTESRPKNSGYVPVAVTRYTADVTVWTRSGAALPGLTVSKHTVKMRCEDVKQYGVP